MKGVIADGLSLIHIYEKCRAAQIICFYVRKRNIPVRKKVNFLTGIFWLLIKNQGKETYVRISGPTDHSGSFSHFLGIKSISRHTRILFIGTGAHNKNVLSLILLNFVSQFFCKNIQIIFGFFENGRTVFRVEKNCLQYQGLFVSAGSAFHFFRSAACRRTGRDFIIAAAEIFFTELPVFRYKMQIFYIYDCCVSKSKRKSFFYVIDVYKRQAIACCFLTK